MGIINIQPVQREGARLLIVLCGVSGSGKTKTAIELAYGMTNGDGTKIGFLDTENGRGKLYADEVPTPYLYGELKPPFSPVRYVQAIDEFAKTGVEVLIVDSGSHEYEGIGGVQDIAEAGNPRMPNWNKAKSAHKSFMSAVLSSPFHIILCLRAREKAKPEKQWIEGKEKTVYVDLGLQPITEKNVVFEATASLMLHSEGTKQESIKVPGPLRAILGRGEGYITQADGKAIRAWVDGAKQLDPKVEHHRGLLQMAAEKGMAELQSAWKATPAAIKHAIGPHGCPDELKASAVAFDQARREAEEAAAGTENDPTVDALNQAAEQAANHGSNTSEGVSALNEQVADTKHPESNTTTQQSTSVATDDATQTDDDDELFGA